MGLIDSHAHLTDGSLIGQIDDVLGRCAQADVDGIITIGIDPDDARAATELAERFPWQIWSAVGVHPHNAARVSSDDIDGMADLWQRPQVIAIGEIGLDYHYDFAERSVQKDVLTRQLELAARYDLPLVIHCREATDDTIALLVNHGFAHKPVVFHCFTGSAEEESAIRQQGWRISFTGIVTFKNSEWLQRIARTYPAEWLMVETDSPYLAPVPVRGKRPNEPAHVAHIARFLADLRSVDYETFVQQTASNTRVFFGV